METQVRTRTVQPEDFARFVRRFHQLSTDTVYRRFHSTVPRLRPEVLHRLVEVHHDLRDAVVALVDGEVIGVARYDRSALDPTTADFAVPVKTPGRAAASTAA